MTNEEAIKALKRIRDEAIDDFIGDWQDYEAFDVALKALAERKDEPQTDYRITGTIGYRCPKCGRGNFLNNEANCVYCGEPLIKTKQQSNILLDAMAKAFGIETEPLKLKGGEDVHEFCKKCGESKARLIDGERYIVCGKVSDLVCISMKECPLGKWVCEDTYIIVPHTDCAWKGADDE